MYLISHLIYKGFEAAVLHIALYTKTQRHRDTETQRHRDTETQRHRDTETQRHRDTETTQHNKSNSHGLSQLSRTLVGE